MPRSPNIACRSPDDRRRGAASKAAELALEAAEPFTPRQGWPQHLEVDIDVGVGRGEGDL
ncbi:hypothetical protein FEI13_08995 [Halomonas urmiana]|uniref:Uncharacterized protein n=1 Tax=Halomonas urmiana TaxID=490901 RepID=A0A5R8MH34_9GAMM|nr:hypothetical protein FEI13_08995 [Halomonas urmiana]